MRYYKRKIQDEKILSFIAIAVNIFDNILSDWYLVVEKITKLS